MKKKIKKISKEQELRKLLEEAKDNLRRNEKSYLRVNSILEQTIAVLEGGQHYDRMIMENLPIEVMKLKSYRSYHEGAIMPYADVTLNQREIIRWLINPDTAENSKELESLRRQFGPSCNPR